MSFSQISYGFEDNNSISEWGSFGILKSGHFSHPQYAEVGDDGSVYISDLGNKRIQKFSSNGEYLTEWGQSGKHPGGFHFPTGVGVSHDSVFVADSDLNRIQKFSLEGEFISQWGQKGKTDGKFFFPHDVAVKNDIVYVVDTGNQRVQMFSTDGEFISSFGTSGLGDGQFVTPVGIDIDSEGNVYVTDKGNHKIEKFTGDGDYLQTFEFYYSNYVFTPEAITVDESGDMYILNSATQRILHLSQDSDKRLSIFDQFGPYPHTFDLITDLEIGINGEILIVDSASHTIKIFETPFYEKPVIVESSETPQIIEEIYVDKEWPIIIAPPSITVEAEDYRTIVSYGEATATDASGIKAILNNAPDYFLPGKTTITWIAFDNTGYDSNTTQTVTVKACGHDTSLYNIIYGTEGDDIIQGTDAADLIFGMGGDDVISGGDGNDCIFGGPGNDIVTGDAGDDSIRGNSGSNVLRGNAGSDAIYSVFYNDLLDGGENFDRCYYSPDASSVTLLNCEE